VSIDHLLDGRCRVWRHTEGATSFVPDTLTPAAEERLYIAPVDPTRLDRGAGMVDIERRMGFMRLGADIRAEDVLEVFAGPETGTTWRGAGRPQRPRSHHVEIVLEPWNGVLPS